MELAIFDVLEHGALGHAQDLCGFVDGEPFAGYDLHGVPEFSDFALNSVELLFEVFECFAVEVYKLHGCHFFELGQMQLQWSDSAPRPFIE